MGLWGNSNNTGANSGLMPGGLGGGPSYEQKALFAQAANDSGLSAMGMGMADQMTSGPKMRNEDQLAAFYHLMAAHPNEVALFFLHYPEFLPGIIEAIRLVIKQELYGFFSSEVTSINTIPEKAAELGYSTITQENIDSAIAKAAPMDKMQMEVHQSDMNAVQQMNGHSQGQMHSQYQQQQMFQQQQMQQQQMMMQQQMPQRQGIGGMIGGFGSSLIRGTLGLPPAQQPQPTGMNPQMGYQQQMPPQM